MTTDNKKRQINIQDLEYCQIKRFFRIDNNFIPLPDEYLKPTEINQENEIINKLNKLIEIVNYDFDAMKQYSDVLREYAHLLLKNHNIDNLPPENNILFKKRYK
jgi:hypothetical protein